MGLSFQQARRAPTLRREPRRLLARIRIEEHAVASRLVLPMHRGVRLAHLSDLHVAAALRPRRLLRAVTLVNAHRPDVALLTGDYVCTSARALPGLVAALRRLQVPTFATLGNHDHWVGARAVAAALARAGVRVLQNEHVTLALRGEPVHLIGIDDASTGHADAAAALARTPGGGTRIALTHDPRVAEELEHGRVALVLAGHTHGGQIRVPGVTAGLARRVGVKYLEGLFEAGDTLLYVNRGLGAALPVRIAVPTEVAFFVLEPAGDP